MVQITNAIVAAALIVPALAAPVIESREPKGFRSAVKVAKKVASGASLGLTVGGLLQNRDEIEAREPRITSAQAKSIAKGAGAIAKTAKSGIEFGAAVAPLFPHKQRRDVEELDARKFRVSGSTLKKAGHALAGAAGFAGTVAAMNTQQQRDFEDNELQSRKFRVSSSTLKHVGHAAAGAAGFAGTVAALNTQQQRNFDEELDARHFSVGKVLKTAGKIAGNFIREDEIEAREPKFRVSGSTLKHIGHAAAGAAGFAGTVAAMNTQQQREFDEELDARHFSVGKVFKTAEKIAGNFIREDEIEAREPKFRVSGSTLKHIGHAAAGAAGFAGTVAAMNTQQQRDFDEELDARHFSVGKVLKTAGKIAGNFIREDEIEAREPKFRVSGSTLKHIGHAAAGAAGFAGTVAAINTQQQRDFDEELDAREPLVGGLVKTAFKVAKHFIRDEETGDIYVVREATNIDELD